MRAALERINAVIKEIEDKVAAGHISPEDAADAIAKIRLTHERLNRLEEKLNARPTST